MKHIKKNKFMKDELKLRDFQQEAIWFLLYRSKALLALPVGSGKTITSFSTYTYIKCKNPNTKLIYVTEKPLIKQTAFQDLPKYFKDLSYTYIYNHNKRQRETIYRDWRDNKDIIIINYASLRVDFEYIGDILKTLIDKNFKIVSFFDEATNFKNPKAVITNCVKLLCKASYKSYGMTATPMISGLYDCFNILSALGNPPYKTKREFDIMHCKYESRKMMLMNIQGKRRVSIATPDNNKSTSSFYVSLKNIIKAVKPIKIMTKPSVGMFSILNENNGSFRLCIKNTYRGRTSFTFMYDGKVLHNILSVYDDYTHTGYKNLKGFKKSTEDIMFVKSKADIAKELPPLTLLYHTCKENKESSEVISEIYKSGKYSASQIEIALITPQAYNKSLKRNFISDKVEQLIKYLRDDIPDEKAIIFFPYTQTTSILKEILDSELNTDCAYATGEVKDIESEVNRFINDNNCRVLIGTTTILKGINLQAINYICVLQCPYTFSYFQQLCGRINRIGTTSSFKIIKIFVNEDCRDEDIFKTVMQQAKLVKETDHRLVDAGIIPEWVDDKYKPMTEDQAKKYLEEKIEKDKQKYI